VRTSRKTVTFARPFSLRRIDEVQPAGTYTVETDEELVLPSRPGGAFLEQVVDIDPLELEAAQKLEATQERDASIA